MAKSFSFDFKIGAMLGAGFTAAFNTAKSVMSGTTSSVSQMNAQQKQLAAGMNQFVRQQNLLNKALKTGHLTQQQYTAGMSSLQSKIQANQAAQNNLAAAINRTNNAQKAQRSLNGAFSTGPINAFRGAITGTTGAISGMIGKLSGMAALAATGFGLTSLVGGAVDAGESVYQLSTKLHMTAGEASTFNRVLSLTGADTNVAAKAIMNLDKKMSASGKSGAAMQATLEHYGVTLTDANGKLLPINQQLQALAAGYKRASEEGTEQEFVMNTLGTKGMELTKTLQNYDEAAEQAAKVKGVGLDPKQMHELKLNMSLLKMEGAQLQLAFTSAFAPLVAQIMPVLVPEMQELAAYISKNKQEIASFAGMAVKFVAMYQGVSMLAGGLHTLVQGFKDVREGASILKAGSALIGGPWTIAIMAIVAVIYLLYTHWDTVSKFISDTWTTVCEKIQSAGESISKFLGGMFESPIVAALSFLNPITAIMYAAAGIISNWSTVKAWLVTLWNDPKAALGQFASFIGSKLSGAWQGVQGIWQGVCSALGAIWNGAVSIVMAGFNLLKAGIQAYIQMWLSMPQRILFAIGFIAGMISQLPAVIGSAVTAAGNFMAQLPGLCVQYGMAFIMAAAAWLASAYDTVSSGIMNTIMAAAEWLMQLPSVCYDAGAAFIAAAAAWLASAYDTTVSWLSNLVSSAGEFLAQLPETCASAGAAFVSSAEEWASGAYNAVLNWIQQIPDMISNYVSNAWANAKASLSAGFSAATGGGGEVAENAEGGIYEKGAFLTTFAEKSREAAIPIDGSPRAVSLWKQTGAMMGVYGDNAKNATEKKDAKESHHGTNIWKMAAGALGFGHRQNKNDEDPGSKKKLNIWETAAAALGIGKSENMTPAQREIRAEDRATSGGVWGQAMKSIGLGKSVGDAQRPRVPAPWQRSAHDNKSAVSSVQETTRANGQQQMPQISIVQNFYGKADPDKVRTAAKQGVEAGAKSFSEKMKEFTAEQERVSFGI